MGLHRSNFVDEDMPGVVEGTSHDLIADGMAAIGQAQSASVRGFRYGTRVPAGWPITMEDIYHDIPIASKLGRTNKASGADLPIHRLTVKRLPTINPPGYNFKMIQPVKGASAATCQMQSTSHFTSFTFSPAKAGLFLISGRSSWRLNTSTSCHTITTCPCNQSQLTFGQSALAFQHSHNTHIKQPEKQRPI